MEEQSQPEQSAPNFKSTGMIAGGISIALVLLIILQHNLSFQKTAQTIIPAGNTYLGPSNEPTAQPETQSEQPAVPAQPEETAAPEPDPSVDKLTTDAAGKIVVPKTWDWVTYNGKKYTYSFDAPKGLKLVTFPNDLYDIYAIAWQNTPPDQNVLVGVDDLSRTDKLKPYISVSKRSYVESWWKQFGGLKGVASINEFTNSKGLKGYKAKFLNAANQTPNTDVFFETPDPKYVIHLASGILSPSVFDKLIDSVAWKK